VDEKGRHAKGTAFRAVRPRRAPEIDEKWGAPVDRIGLNASPLPSYIRRPVVSRAEFAGSRAARRFIFHDA
jgi:hypothetical protein